MLHIRYSDRVALCKLELADFSLTLWERALEVMNEERMKGFKKDRCDITFEIFATKVITPLSKRRPLGSSPPRPNDRVVGIGVKGGITQTNQLLVQREERAEALTGVALYQKQLVDKY